MLVKSQVKYIQSLSQKKLREEQGLFIAEGPKIINELLTASNCRLKELYATEEWMSGHKKPEESDNRNITLIDEKDLERISSLSTPNQVLGIFYRPSFKETIHLNGNITLMLDGIQDPGNMGTILRCADWFGISQVICTEDCADVFGSKVIQSTMGSIARVQVKYADAAQVLDQHPDIPVFAALLNGKDLFSYSKIREGIILIGNESKGIRSALLKGNLHRITIPRKGAAESLNAAVATGIILSHLT